MNEAFKDQPQAPRSGEAVDRARLQEYLRPLLPEPGTPVEISQFRQGYSNLTYLIRAGDREWVLRRPPVGAQIKSAHDMGREYRILSHLQGFYPLAPKPVLYCEDPSVLGAPFYLMNRVQGIILRRELPAGLHLDEGTLRALSESFIDNLSAIHRVDFRAAGLADLGKPEGYVRRQIEGWTKRYQQAQTDTLVSLEEMAAWLGQNQPAEAGGCLIHNDYKYDNLVLDPNQLPRILATLDWEMATLGDPLMDLGSALGYWVDADDPEAWRKQAFGITSRPGNLNREALLARYAQATGRSIGAPVFYYVYGLFKIAVIVQQIYARYRKGLTQDERFAGLIEVVKDAARMGCLAIERGRISGLGGG